MMMPMTAAIESPVATKKCSVRRREYMGLRRQAYHELRTMRRANTSVIMDDFLPAIA